MVCFGYDDAGHLVSLTTYRNPDAVLSTEPAEMDGEDPVVDSHTPARSYVYNHLGQLTQVIDAAGTRTIGYNQYGEQETDSLVVDDDTHLITETRDAQGLVLLLSELLCERMIDGKSPLPEYELPAFFYEFTY